MAYGWIMSQMSSGDLEKKRLRGSLISMLIVLGVLDIIPGFIAIKTHVISDPLKDDFDFWIARYPRKDSGDYNPKSSLRPSYRTAVAWQYSSKGHVDGIKGNVDMDVDFDGVVNLIAKEPYKKTNQKRLLMGNGAQSTQIPQEKSS